MTQESEHTCSKETSGSSINANNVLDSIGTAAAVLPIIEAVAPQVLQLYRQFKESGELREVIEEVFGDMKETLAKIDMANVERNIAAINAYKAAGISEVNAVALRCARYNGKFPDIKVNMNS